MTRSLSSSRRAMILGVVALGAAVGVSGPASLAQTPAPAEKPAPALNSMAATPAGAPVPLSELMAPSALPDIIIGKADAPVLMVEYASLTCTHCARFVKDVFPLLKSKYIDTGKVRYILREFPLDPLAYAAAMLARCSGDKRTAVADLLFMQQGAWAFVDKPKEALATTMKQTGMTEDTFNKCLENQKLYSDIREIYQRAQTKFAINSTPTFFINGERHTGEITAAELDPLMARFLENGGAAPTTPPGPPPGQK